MTSPTPQKRICIGKIATTHGVKGLVKLLPYCKDISLLNGELYTSDNPTDHKTLTITLKNSMGKHVLASIEDITTPEDAKKLKHSLYIPRETLPETDDGKFYIEDLIGLEAKNNNNKDVLGTVQSVDNFGAGNLLEIKPIDGTATYYVPFNDDCVDNVDLEAKCIMLKNTDAFRME